VFSDFGKRFALLGAYTSGASSAGILGVEEEIYGLD
jgi:hypothetical protein